MCHKYRLLASVAFFAAPLCFSSTANAQAMSDAEKIQRLEHQTELLQKQLKELKDEIATMRKKAEKVEAAQASSSASHTASSGAAVCTRAITAVSPRAPNTNTSGARRLRASVARPRRTTMS